jgi:DNA-binding transcriptional MerR regulator
MADDHPSETSPKMYYRIGEVASLVGVEPHVLRYWEREFRTIRPTKSAKGQRIYSRRDVSTLVQIRELLYNQGFTIAGARKRLSSPPPETSASKDGPAPAAPSLREQLVALREEALNLLSELQEA